MKGKNYYVNHGDGESSTLVNPVLPYRKTVLISPSETDTVLPNTTYPPRPSRTLEILQLPLPSCQPIYLIKGHSVITPKKYNGNTVKVTRNLRTKTSSLFSQKNKTKERSRGTQSVPGNHLTSDVNLTQDFNLPSVRCTLKF